MTLGEGSNESIVWYATLKYPDRQTDDFLRLSTVERESPCVRVLVLVRSTLTVPYYASFSITIDCGPEL